MSFELLASVYFLRSGIYTAILCYDSYGNKLISQKTITQLGCTVHTSVDCDDSVGVTEDTVLIIDSLTCVSSCIAGSGVSDSQSTHSVNTRLLQVK